MNKPTYKRILEHPDREEIIAKLAMGKSPSELHDWLSVKYSSVNEKKFVISDKILSSFKNTYLDFYTYMQSDIALVKQSGTENVENLDLIVKNNPSYNDALVKMVNGELDVRSMIAKLIVNMELRLSQIFDLVQENPRDVNTRVERLLSEYADKLGVLLEKYYKFTESPPDQIIQHNFTLQTVDQHIAVFYDVIKETLAQMDVDTSLYFMEVFNEKMSKIKIPPKEPIMTTEAKLAQVKVINEQINQSLNDG